MRNHEQWLKTLTQVESDNITYVGGIFPLILKKGLGMNLWDVEGKRYADFTACFGVAALGHRPKIALSALRKQSSKLLHGMGDVHPSDSKISFLSLLASMLPYAKPNTILSSTGSEAVETALKTAILATQRHRFISFQGGYHGLLTGPLHLASRAHFTDGFESWIHNRATNLPFPKEDDDLTLLEDELKKRCYAAIILEPVQGRGGDRCFPKAYVQNAVVLAKKYGTLIIFDEVFTGFGRTGTLFGFESFGVVPDILCLGKAMGGGLPLSACVGDVLEVWGKSTGEARHTSTFLGHPLSCAVGHATIKEIRAKLPDFQQELARIDLEFDRFLDATKASGILEKHPFTMSGKGFMRGISFSGAKPGFAFDMTQKLLEEGFILLPCGENGDVLSLTPPLIATAKDYRKLFERVLEVLAEMPRGD